RMDGQMDQLVMLRSVRHRLKCPIPATSLFMPYLNLQYYLTVCAPLETAAPPDHPY
ncbi:unnamed protein product, partial [Closterium sp. Naga37s-1]